MCYFSNVEDCVNAKHKPVIPFYLGAIPSHQIITNELPEKNVSIEVAKIIVYDFSKELASKKTKSDSAEIVVILADTDTYSIRATKKPEIISQVKTASTQNAKNCTDLVGLISSCETEDNETVAQEQNEKEFNIDLDLEVTEELDD